MTFKAPAPDYVGPAAHTSAGSNQPIHRIVLHGTVSPCVAGGARSNAAYFRNQSAGGSAHYVTDPKEAVQVVWDDTIAWHAPPNQNSLGVEMCDPVGDAKGKPLPIRRWNDDDHQAMLRITAKLVAGLCLAYDVPVRFVGPRALRAGARGICEHSDVSQAWGQSSHWDLGTFPRRAFLKMVKEEVALLTQPERRTRPRKRRKATGIDHARALLQTILTRKISRARKKRVKAGLDALPKH